MFQKLTILSKAKGCKVWDMDNREYIDMSVMGGYKYIWYGHSRLMSLFLKQSRMEI